ncbi:hypothetical protein DEAC_c43220 [Desulfosporosinus acididurans]|uniref:Uncharacterized protein n=1 Tax=Desulfosporosinus acididurans TaxID=476652 RepID=A0A0J1FJV7_9FIRM|nr:hypothetical protein DEAC_c43220 [Desulfosporosinus acididurans]
MQELTFEIRNIIYENKFNGKTSIRAKCIS